MSADSRGFFGKLPAHGDFVERGFPAAAIAGWDDWLQQAVAISREQLGERWLDTYLVSPLWRFGLSSGCVDNGSWLGVLMPSVDSVGRYFPLVLAHGFGSDCHLTATFLAAQDWFAELESTALAALDHNLNAEALQARLTQLPAPPLCSAPAPGAAVFCAQDMSTALPHLLEWRCHSDTGAASLWSTTGSSAVPAGVALARGLPPAAGFAALLDGNWSAWGWSFDGN